MPPYHSSFNKSVNLRAGNMAILPIKTEFPGPAQRLNQSKNGDYQVDIIDEALKFFKANVFFKNYNIQGDADRTLIYLMLYINECLRVIQKCTSKAQASKEIYALGLRRFSIPGESQFPLNSMFTPSSSKQEEETMVQYLQQLQLETGSRLIERVFPVGSEGPSKWWTCFVKRRFMNKCLTND
ncbi:hypothetical protein ACOME3_007821 [Neoechinorhynchus agilis]